MICFQISRSGGVFLHQGWLGPRKANAQKSAVWPCPSCNCTDWVQIEKASWKYLNLFPVFRITEFTFSYLTLTSQLSLSVHFFGFISQDHYIRIYYSWPFKSTLMCCTCSFSLLFFFLPQVCDCERIFFEGLTAIAFSSHKRSQRNIILPILLKRKHELGAFLRPFV